MPRKIKLKYGQGSISYREKEKIYQARYYKDGKQCYLYAKTQQEIKAKLKKAIQNKDKNIDTGLTLAEWLNKWLTVYKRQQVRDSTYNGLKTNINKYLIPKLGHYHIDKLNSFIIQTELNSIEYARQKVICYDILNASYKKAVQLNLTNNNYMIAVEKQKAVSIKGKALTLTEQNNFINALNNFADFKIIFLAYLYTGTRRNELLSLKYEDIDFKNNFINIKGTKSHNAVRQIPLNLKLKELLNCNKQGIIFDFTPSKIDHKFRKICDSINLNGFTVHSLRHTFATRCLEKNISAKVVQEWLGHSKINLTLDTYTHIQNDFKKEQNIKINDVF